MVKDPLTDPRRKLSEDLAWQAELAMRKAKQLFFKAAEHEEYVALRVPKTSPRLRSILAISAVSLWHKASEPKRVKKLAGRFLRSKTGLTKDGRVELERLASLNEK